MQKSVVSILFAPLALSALAQPADTVPHNGKVLAGATPQLKTSAR